MCEGCWQEKWAEPSEFHEESYDICGECYMDLIAKAGELTELEQ
jgi:hypothetical protein